MPLEKGTRLGPYEIVSRLGAGGMGEVYRARDVNLRRDVAIKVLPAELTEQAERLSRFEREAGLLAALNHPNVATIYGLEREGGKPYLAMELVEGPTLDERFAEGPLPMAETLAIFRQVALGLEAAHAKSIVHRDLKPANVKLGSDDTVKLLDFGLAKAFGGGVAELESSDLPTRSPHTARGVVLGTPSYMSPEQAQGRPVDKRADIWAFGCCLYEALTGKRPFRGDTMTDVLAALLKDEPAWDALPEATPAGVRRVLRRCLRKEPERRLRDVGDARLELEEAMDERSPSADVAAPIPPSRGRALSALAAFIAGAVLAALVLTTLGDGPPPDVRRLQVQLAPGSALAIQERDPLALSRDGRVLVYVGRRESTDTTELYRRALDELESHTMPGTEGASGPFLPADGSVVGFFAGMEVRRIALTGAASHAIGGAPPVTRGASWAADDFILISPSNAHGVARTSTVDGSFSMVAAPDASRGEKNHTWPHALPGGSSALITILKTGQESYDAADIAVLDLDTGSIEVVLEGGYHARYVPSGHIVFVSVGALKAAPFSLSERRVTGDPVPVVPGVMTDPRTGAAYFTVSDTGTLVFAPGGVVSSLENRLVWVDRAGTTTPVSEERRVFTWPRLSPDGKRLAVTIEGASDDLWIYELERRTFTRLTFDSRNIAPLWTPDGERLVFSTVAGQSTPNLVVQTADGGGSREPLLATAFATFGGSWTPDGGALAFMGQRQSADIFVSVLGEGDSPVPFLDTRFEETSPAFSPDGRWLAYVSDESGRREVYVRPFPGPGGKVQISTEGGEEPLWARNGAEIFYRSGTRMMAARVTTEPALEVVATTALFEGSFKRSPIPGVTNYDVSADGRFLMVESAENRSGPTHLNVVLNWVEDLRRATAAP